MISFLIFDHAITVPESSPVTKLSSFLTSHGWDDTESHPLVGDASDRRYYRLIQKCLTHSIPDTIVLAEYGKSGSDIISFITVSELLCRLGFSVPVIEAYDIDAGLMLVEDFGDNSFTALLDREGCSADTLYTLATDVLIALHRCLPESKTQTLALPRFTSYHFIDELMIFVDVYLKMTLGRSPTVDERVTFKKAWQNVVALAYDVPISMVLRDFHAGNMIYLPHRSGIKACGLLDFQDAGIGPITYDLISLLSDARRKVSQSLITEMIQRYLIAFPTLDPHGFNRSLAILGAVRHTRIIGVFARLAMEQKRFEYLKYLSRVWQLLEHCLIAPDLAPVSAWFDHYVPRSYRQCLPFTDS